MADYDIAEAFQKIEEEMIASMSRNLKRHLKKELDEGINYSMWQAEQLAALNNFRKDNAKTFKSYFSTVNKQIETILKMAYQSGAMDQEVQILEAIKKGWKVSNLPTSDALQGSFFKINERKLNALIEATTKDMAKAETAMLRMANDEYRKVIYNSEVYYNTGAGTLSQCVDMATKDFLSRGITCIEYANGARVAIDSYAQMALRTAQTRAYLTGEASMRDEWGVSTVIVNKRGVACPRCLQWVGRVFYDDVWGSAPIPSPAKYPLLSEAVAGGLYHPNCKDIHTTYFEDVNTPPEPMTEAQKKEAARVYDLEQKQRYNERMIRKYKRLEAGSVDPENVKKYAGKRQEWQEHQREFVKANGDVLKRRYENEKLRVPATLPEPPKTAGSTKVSETSDRSIVNKYGQTVVFDKQMDSEKWSESAAIIRDLADEYDTRLTTVGTGASGAAGDVNMGGAMRLSSTANDVAIHEFAHTMATEALTKYGVVDDSEFWKEVKSVRRAYRKDVGDDSIRWISSYEHSTRSIDEFFAEAFTQAKMDQMGMPLPNKYGNDLTYSKQVLEITDKYFKKKRGLSAKIDEIDGKALTSAAKDGIIKRFKITADEESALTHYISSESYGLNRALRAGATLTAEQEMLRDGLISALDKLPSYEGTVYRSLSSEMIENIEIFNLEHRPGNIVRYSAFTSTGTEVYDASMDIQFIIQSKNGKDIRSFNPNEHEILFRTNSGFLVKKREGNTIWMEEV
jgi:ribosomal protein S9